MTLRQQRQVDVLAERLALRVHVEDLQAAVLGRGADVDVAREAAGAQQRRVERVEAVGGGDHEQPLVAAEAVHLDQELVEGLVGLAVAAAFAAAAAALGADGVDLVDEDDRRACPGGPWRRGRGRGPAPTPTYISTKSEPDIGEERGARLAGDGLGEQRLAGAGRSVEHQAGRHLGAEPPVAPAALEEVDELGGLLHGLVAAGDVAEAHRRQLALLLRVLGGLVLRGARGLGLLALQEEHRGDHRRRCSRASSGSRPTGSPCGRSSCRP